MIDEQTFSKICHTNTAIAKPNLLQFDYIVAIGYYSRPIPFVRCTIINNAEYTHTASVHMYKR